MRGSILVLVLILMIAAWVWRPTTPSFVPTPPEEEFRRFMIPIRTEAQMFKLDGGATLILTVNPELIQRLEMQAQR